MVQIRPLAALLCSAALLLGACGAAGEGDLAEASATAGPSATAAPSPTVTPTASPSPALSPTPEPEASATPAPCPTGTQSVVPGGECLAVPSPAPSPAPAPAPAPAPSEAPPAAPAPSEAPPAAPVADPCDRAPRGFTSSMTDFAFSPAARSNVCVGDTVTFVNDGVVSHTATNRAGAFDTGSVAGGGQATVTIASAGEVSYVCLFHGQMRGTIEVVG